MLPWGLRKGPKKDHLGGPRANREAERRRELLAETDRYIADLIAEVGPPWGSNRHSVLRFGANRAGRALTLTRL